MGNSQIKIINFSGIFTILTENKKNFYSNNHFFIKPCITNIYSYNDIRIVIILILFIKLKFYPSRDISIYKL